MITQALNRTIPRVIARAGEGLILPSLGILFLAGLLVGLHTRTYPSLSPVDEFAHIDYLYKASRGEIVRMGDRVGQEAMAEEACRGIDVEGFRLNRILAEDYELPPCALPGAYDPADFQYQGYALADIYPPTYYAVTGVTARGTAAIFGLESLVTPGRLMGAAWLGAAGLVIWLVGLRLGIGRLPLVVVLVLVMTTPAVLHAMSTVNPDATAPLAGAGLIALTLLWEERAAPILLLPAAALLAVSMKPTNGLVVGTAVLYLLLRWWTNRGKGEGRRFIIGAASLMAGSAGAVLGWSLIHEMLSLVSTHPQIELFRVEGLSFDQVTSQVLALVPPIADPYTPAFLRGPAVLGLIQVFGALLIAAGLTPALSLKALDRAGTLAVAGLATLVSGGVVLTIMNFYLNSHIFVPIPPRYGMTILPALALGLAARLRSPSWLWFAGGLATVSLIVSLYHLI